MTDPAHRFQCIRSKTNETTFPALSQSAATPLRPILPPSGMPLPNSPTQRLLLAAHGAGDDSPANELIRELCQKVSNHLPTLPVSPAFNMGSPSFPEVLGTVPESNITLIPVMTGRGWFVDTKLPAEIAKHPRASTCALQFTSPVGCVREVVETAVTRAADAFRALASRTHQQPQVIVVAHGSSRSPASVSAGRRLARLLRERLGVEQVHAAFLDDQPLLEDVAPNLPGPLLVLPWLIGGGSHARNDIPERLGTALERSHILPALGDDLDLLVRAILRLAAGDGCGWGDLCCTIDRRDELTPPPTQPRPAP